MLKTYLLDMHNLAYRKQSFAIAYEYRKSRLPHIKINDSVKAMSFSSKTITQFPVLALSDMGTQKEG